MSGTAQPTRDDRAATPATAPRPGAAAMLRAWLAAFVLLLSASPAALAQTTTVTLRTAASVAEGEPVLLADVAALDGPLSDELGRAVLLDTAGGHGGWTEIDISQVRAALDELGVNWGRIVLRGSRCALRTGRIEPVSRGSESGETDAGTGSLAAPGTVGAAVLARLSALYAVPSADLRARFRGEDRSLLLMQTAGRRVEVQVSATDGSSRVPARIYVYTGDRLLASGSVSVEVQIRREVVVATQTIERNAVIEQDSVARERRWLSPGGRRPAAPGQVIGALTRARISAGQVVSADDVEPPVVVRRGELVMVHCLSGSIMVKVKARALHDARDGELVRLQLRSADGRRARGDQRTFTARMNGRGRAVMVVGDDADAFAERPVVRAVTSGSGSKHR